MGVYRSSRTAMRAGQGDGRPDGSGAEIRGAGPSIAERPPAMEATAAKVIATVRTGVENLNTLRKCDMMVILSPQEIFGGF